jgi:hypothetical protein
MARSAMMILNFRCSQNVVICDADGAQRTIPRKHALQAIIGADTLPQGPGASLHRSTVPMRRG